MIQIVKVLKAGFLLLLIPLPVHLPASRRSTTLTWIVDHFWGGQVNLGSPVLKKIFVLSCLIREGLPAKREAF